MQQQKIVNYFFIRLSVLLALICQLCFIPPLGHFPCVYLPMNKPILMTIYVYSLPNLVSAIYEQFVQATLPEFKGVQASIVPDDK